MDAGIAGWKQESTQHKKTYVGKQIRAKKFRLNRSTTVAGGKAYGQAPRWIGPKTLAAEGFFAICIMAVVVFPIFAGARMLEPCGVGAIPVDGAADAVFEGNLGSPSEFAADFGAVQCITSIMTRAIFYILHQRLRFTEVLENGLNDLQIRLWLAGRYVVNLTGFPFFERQSDGPTIVFDEKPIPLLHTISVDRKHLVFPRIGNDKGNQFLGKLERAVVVGATKNDCGDAVGVGVCGHKMIRRSFASGIGAARVKNGFFRKTASCRRAAVNLIRADVDKAREFAGACRFEKTLGARDIGPKKRRRVFDASVHVSFGSEIHERVECQLEDISHLGGIANVAANEVVARVRGQVAKALRVS